MDKFVYIVFSKLTGNIMGVYKTKELALKSWNHVSYSIMEYVVIGD